jgi:hypothetical protein
MTAEDLTGPTVINLPPGEAHWARAYPMTDEDSWSSAESSRHDPLLRLDQMIARQDEMLRLLKLQNEIQRLVVFALSVLVFLAVILLVYLIWH